MFIARQGDVLIKSVEDIPEYLEEVKLDNNKIVLAYGEVTGHSHSIKDLNAAYFFDKKSNKFYLLVNNPVELVHEEHSTINIPIGNYEIIRQRFYTPERIKNVAD